MPVVKDGPDSLHDVLPYQFRAGTMDGAVRFALRRQAIRRAYQAVYDFDYCVSNCAKAVWVRYAAGPRAGLLWAPHGGS